jgi:predicted SAM-dependent methyltransferase
MGSAVKLNLGCGSRPLEGYINIDQDDLAAMRARYPTRTFDDSLTIETYDIFNLPYPDNSVDEVRAESMLEHLSFVEEGKFFHEVRRVLKSGGIVNISVPNFEKIFQAWLNAKDEWREFYRTDREAIERNHWFGHYSTRPNQRWGYLMASIFGNQNGAGQFHKNAFSIGKLRAIFKYLDFRVIDITEFLWQGDRDPMIRIIGAKNARE